MLPLGKYLTVLPLSHKLIFGKNFVYIQAFDVVCGVGKNRRSWTRCDFSKFVPRIFVHFLYFLSLMQRLAETVEVLFLISLLTYPMINWCILRKYISRPLLLLQSVPCRHTGSEMYLKPSRPRMHANSASRRKYFSVLQRLASCVTRLSGSCCFPQ